MNADRGIDRTATNPASCERPDLLSAGFDALDPYLADRDRVLGALDGLAALGDDAATRLADRLRNTVEALEPSVTMIGQVKAGKTTLVNAMAGWPGLLPADVNPWTSVVTSLHLSPMPVADDTPRARFRFFNPTEWDRLLQKGGRIGELANRAGHADEIEKVRAQVEKMREKSRTRLGRRFEMLLGQEHEYGRFDPELIERYVCLGDDFDDDDDDDINENQGRFADITKSAELQIPRSEFPIPICIRDTPGVNDTFMMREQITIRAIRDSRICVVVLSAHQALSTVDMALIRLITNIRSREVIIFVNRIDELSDPVQQVPEIEASIRKTLHDHGTKEEVEIVFGSATWANTALSGNVEALDAESDRALGAWMAATQAGAAATPETVWQASGIPALYRAFATRIAEGIGRETLSKAARSAMNLAATLEAGSGPGNMARDCEVRMDNARIEAELAEIGRTVTAALDERLGSEIAAFSTRLDRAHRSFLERATASLVEHLENKGEATVWKYEPTGLRLLLRSAYQVFGARTLSTAEEAFGEAAKQIGALYARAFDGLPEMEIAPPPVGHVPPPVVIGQTIALDLQGNWWRNWWRRRRGYESFATEFYSMIEAETAPIVEDLRDGQAEAMRRRVVETAREFLDEQRQILVGMADRQRAVAAGEVLVLSETDQKRSAVEDTLAVLRAIAA